MTWEYSNIFAYPNKENVKSYIFVATDNPESFFTLKRHGYSSVEFDTIGRGMNYPIILDDFTRSDYPFTTFDTKERRKAPA